MPKKSAAGEILETNEVVGSDDAPELTDEFFDAAEFYHGNTFIKRGRGRPPTGNAKEQVTVRLDQEVLAKLRANGPGWQTRVNAMLRRDLGLDKGVGEKRHEAD